MSTKTLIFTIIGKRKNEVFDYMLAEKRLFKD